MFKEYKAFCSNFLEEVKGWQLFCSWLTPVWTLVCFMFPWIPPTVMLVQRGPGVRSEYCRAWTQNKQKFTRIGQCCMCVYDLYWLWCEEILSSLKISSGNSELILIRGKIIYHQICEIIFVKKLSIDIIYLLLKLDNTRIKTNYS